MSDASRGRASKLIVRVVAGFIVIPIFVAVAAIVGLSAYDRFWSHHPADAEMIAFFNSNRARFSELETLCTTQRILLPSENIRCQEVASALQIGFAYTNLLNRGEVEAVTFAASGYEDAFNISYPLWFYTSVKGYVYLRSPSVRPLNRVTRDLPKGAVGQMDSPRKGVVFAQLDNAARNIGDEVMGLRLIEDGWYLYYVEFHRR